MRLSKVTIAYSLLFLLFLFFSGCGPLFFYPQKQLYDNPVARQFSPEDIYFKTPDGLTLHGWFLRTHAKAQGSILVLHGNAENLSTHVNSVLWLVDKGFNIFIFDYQGYGRSQGEPTIAGVHRDAEAALETLLSMPQVDKEQIIVLGQSIGGAIAVYTVANTPYKDRIAALVIDSAFSSYRRIAREKLAQVFITWPFQYPLSLFFNDDYSPVKWIKKVAPVPLLIIHGEQDPVVPGHHGQMLYDTALQPKDFWKTTVPGHVSSFADEGVREKLVGYLTEQMKKDVIGVTKK
jgi:fermentation-respiration switch protein FrsA (DUF1100 family)